jgi:glyoxylase-like metal-dependent hydrolase (beta-lactamase superfamily II)/rhodanese-related sulfurtransferase
MLSIEEPLEVGPETLKHKIDSGEEFVLLDVRTPWEYDAWSINYAGVEPLLLPVQDLFSQPEAVLERIPLNKEVLIVCAHGNRSLFAAQILTSLGYRAKSVRGGMNMLNALCDTAEIHIDSELLILQIRRIVKGCVGYILASRETGEAAIVDPQHLAHTSCLEETKRLGLRVVAVVETHRPLDHISGGHKLSETLKAPLYTFSTLQPAPNPETIRLGSYTLQPVTLNQHLNYTILVLSKPGSKTPTAVFTGDLLFTDGYARPDTLGAANLEEQAKALYQLYDWLFENIPADTVVLPSHCTPQNIRKGNPIQATLGEIKSRLWSPKPRPDELLDFLLKHLPQKPANHELIAQINTNPQKYLPIADERKLRDIESGQNNMIIRKHRPP